MSQLVGIEGDYISIRTGEDTFTRFTLTEAIQVAAELPILIKKLKERMLSEERLKVQKANESIKYLENL